MTTIDAPQPDSRSVIRSTAATSAFVVGWYALPDYVRSRPVRAVLKTAGLVTFGALGIRDIRPEGGWGSTVDVLRGGGLPPWSGSRSPVVSAPGADAALDVTHEVAADVDGTVHGADAHAERVPQVAALAGAALVVVGSTALTVVVERRVFRRNEARAARGARLPHTRSGLLFGALTALVAIPDVLRSRAVEAAA